MCSIIVSSISIFSYIYFLFFSLKYTVFFSNLSFLTIHYLSEVMTGHNIQTHAFIPYSINMRDYRDYATKNFELR